jgi:hypothetical protein
LATSAAVRTLAKLRSEIPHRQKVEKYLLEKRDAQSGGFAEVGAQPNVVVTSVAILGAVDLGIKKELLTPSILYLAKQAKTFEEVRIAAAAVEAWDVNTKLINLQEWEKIIHEEGHQVPPKDLDAKNGLARSAGSIIACRLRLGIPVDKDSKNQIMKVLLDGQREDGGWGQYHQRNSDLETTYRVMRALHLLKIKPKNIEDLKNYLGKHRHESGGYGATPGAAPRINTTYYVTMIAHWLPAEGK